MCLAVHWVTPSELSKECRSLLSSCSFRIFCHGPRVQRQTQNSLLWFSRAFTPLFPMGINYWIKYKESGSRAHTHSDGKHCSCFQNRATQFLLFSNAKSPSALHHFLFRLSQEALHNHRHSLPNGLPAISEVGWRCTVSLFSISQKEIKYTWPEMLLMFLPINLSTSSVGYWIQYTFLCSNKLFKFLNIKGSKRKKFNFHRRDWKWHHKIPSDWKKPFLKLNLRL